MGDKTCRLGWMILLGTAVAIGCSSKPSDRRVTEPSDRPATDEEAAVRARFAELQSAIEKRDTEKLWTLLAERSRADAERVAKDIRIAHNRAGAEEKTKQEKALDLSGAELAELNGKGFLKTKRFQRKYHEVPESKIDKVVVQGDSATVFFLEPDGDKEKAILVRQNGQWKVWLTMPKVNKP